MKKWIEYPKTEGNTSRQAHANLPEGTFEREMGKEGFFGPASHLYHAHAPTAWVDFEGPLRPHAYDASKSIKKVASPWSRQVILDNRFCEIAWWQTDTKMDFVVRNSDGDQILFVHEGTGDFYCDFGHLEFRDGDYIVIPRGTMWRIEPKDNAQILMIEATNDHFKLPEKGLLGPHALFDPAMLDTPELNDKFQAQKHEDRTRLVVKRNNQLTTITYPFNPLDAVGWKGDLCVARINWRDIRPINSHRFHIPPSVHTTFVSARFVVCTFVPRPIESDPDALKLPFYHNNDDFDEFLFYHRGNFISRDNIHPGMMTWHPCGFTHGPHPKALKAAEAKAGTLTDEVAVMVDTRDALTPTDFANGIEWEDYVDSWK